MNAPPEVSIGLAKSPAALDHARTLILEYGRSLGIDLAYQQFDDEVGSLGRVYGPPAGALLLATLEELPAGCVGVRAFGPACCEMKRLYVRPVARGHGLGRRLAQAAMAEARALGYRVMRLDTLPTMQDAQALYLALGFHDIPPYRHSPVAGTRFLEVSL